MGKVRSMIRNPTVYSLSLSPMVNEFGNHVIVPPAPADSVGGNTGPRTHTVKVYGILGYWCINMATSTSPTSSNFPLP